MINYSLEPQTKKVDALVIPFFEDKKPDAIANQLDQVFEGLMNQVVKLEDFQGKKGESVLLYTQDEITPRVFLIGLGKEKSLTVRDWKQAVGTAVIALQGKKLEKISIVIPKQLIKSFDFNTKKLGYETVLAIEIANYSFDTYKQKDGHIKPFTDIMFAGDFDTTEKKSLQKGIEEGKQTSEGVILTRMLGNTPPSIMTPALIAKNAKDLAKVNNKIKVKVFEKADMEKMGMGCLLGVAKGSVLDPKFIVIEYNNTTKKTKPTVLVGKGVTFDTGGLSLKPGEFMTDMKFDMLGAATVLGIIKASANLELKNHIVGIIPSCENAVSGEAYRPDDILTAMNGRTIEVKNTDAEGRLILADALSYVAKHYKDAKEVIDFATLTGACIVALGNERSGLFSPEENIVNKLTISANNSGEQIWRLPIGSEYSEAIKSLVADVKNIGGVGGPRYAGASTAAAFLQYFTLDHESGEPAYPWAHIDLSSAYYNGAGHPWVRHGANGFGVQTLIEYIRS